MRARYVDLIVRPEARDVAYTRASVVRSIRGSLKIRGFTEVETPVLQLIHGGANARPFETHINAYDPASTCIATELHLKPDRRWYGEGVRDRAAVPRRRGLQAQPRVHLIGGVRDLRRLQHHAGADQDLIQEAATAIYGSPIARRADDDGKITEYDLSGDWPVKTICEAVSRRWAKRSPSIPPPRCCISIAQTIGLELEPSAGWISSRRDYGELCEGQTTTPVFYTDFPKENSPLAREHRDDPRLAEKWDLVIFGAERRGLRTLS